MPTDGVEEELAAARAAVVEHAQQSARRERARHEVAAADEALAAARASLADETQDVQRLESLSLSRVWAGLRGDRAQRLDVERAEQQAAEYVAATAQARREAAARELAAVEAGLAALGDVEARWGTALAVKERWLRDAGGAAAAELADVAERTGAWRAEQREIVEAQAAAEAAARALGAAADELRGADGWSTYDTFFDGGALASMAKHHRLDQAADLLRRADGALRRLTVELGDLGEQGVGDVGVDGFTRTLDIWFDNIFTDWSVRNRIAEARDRVGAAGRAVDAVRQRLAERATAADAELAALAARRETLLVG
ncbi:MULTISPECIES: hypothetical protein [unclassified Isoptericola]|uniref:hypothetical protein n=1 Tax=unclassified Isoptericola TaxID=2623355 RepID=UPI0036634C57